jgi:hypothetical protein
VITIRIKIKNNGQDVEEDDDEDYDEGSHEDDTADNESTAMRKTTRMTMREGG